MPSSNGYFGYIRVSTAKQGEKGVSLQEQKDSIERYAQKHSLEIAQWFEERETAAKRGRPIFTRMLKLVKNGGAKGIIIHKIDRSARNLRDWADLAELMDLGIAVFFSHESLDLNTRGGRLTADIQAVIAADYIRNLRDETRKGITGRLKQGLWPLPAPIGYLDMGAGKPKELNPATAPLVRKAFELYAGGRYNLISLNERLFGLGLRNKRGNRLSLCGISTLLNNPFYIGLLRARHSGEAYQGIHKPLIAPSLFRQVQMALKGKFHTKVQKHNFLFRRLLKCAGCGYSFIGERQKGHDYYRCHTCKGKNLRGDRIEEQLQETLSRIAISEEEQACMCNLALGMHAEWREQQEQEKKLLILHLKQIQDRLDRLTDALVDGLLEKSLYECRKEGLLMERQEVQEKLAKTEKAQDVPVRVRHFLELTKDLNSAFKSASNEEKRELLKSMTSNWSVRAGNVDFMLLPPFSVLANRQKISNSAPNQETPRICKAIWQELVNYFLSHDIPQSWKIGSGLG